MRRSLTALIACVLLLAMPYRVDAQQDYSASVVEIYDLNKNLLGAGTVVSFSGLVLTARHVLELPKISTLRLAVNVSFKDDMSLLRAELVTAHPYLDLAILKIVGAEVSAWIPLPVMLENEGVVKNDEVLLIGHKQNTNELYIERKGLIDDADKSGHIQIGRPVDRGASGGPAIKDGKVLGVIVRSDFLDKTIVTPVWAARDYFMIVGVAFLGNGYAKEQNTTATLIKRVENYEAVFTDILLDLDWSARFKLDSAENADGDQRGDLWIGFSRKLRAQPKVDAHVLLAGGTTSATDSDEQPKVFSLSKWLNPGDPSIRFEDIHREIESIAPDVDISALELDLKIRVEPEIDNMTGHIAGFSNIPDFEICFRLMANNPSPPAYLTGKAIACGKEHAYLDEGIARQIRPGRPVRELLR